ncbi:MAG: esterase [Gemmatimonadetes bacterium]|nr:esterase [Gemmatimonadota bacterium]
MRKRALAVMLAALMVLGGCGSPVTVEAGWLDGPDVNDPSLTDASYRVSTRPGLTLADRTRPVVIGVHGFTASTFEWQEFRDHAEGSSPVLVSLVLLGGHGRTVDEFRASSWRDWGDPILVEYRALVAQGYTNISLAGSSTAGALMLEQVASGRFEELPNPRHIFLIDPIVVATDKSLSLIPLLKYLVSNVVSEGTAGEASHWYANRPAEALAQLNQLIGRVRSQLARGVVLPTGTRAKVYKTSSDPTADPVSALLIYKGLRTADGQTVDVQMLPSTLHVFTRLLGRDPATVSEADRRRQMDAFQEMIQKVSQ